MNPSIQLVIITIVTILISVLIIILCRKNNITDSIKNRILKISAILTVILHYSVLWVDYFTTGEAYVHVELILPIFPCHICMWLLLICSFIKNKESRIAKMLFEFTAYAGVICGAIGLIVNTNFLSTPSYADYYVLKGLLSHSTMIFGCMALFGLGYVKISVKHNMISVISGLLLFLVDGAIINLLFMLFDLPSVNAMYLVSPPFPDLPLINVFTIGILAVILLFAFTYTYECIRYDKEERFSFKSLKR